MIGGYVRGEAAGMLMVTIAGWSVVKICRYDECEFLNSCGAVNQKAVSVCAEQPHTYRNKRMNRRRFNGGLFDYLFRNTSITPRCWVQILTPWALK